VRPCLCFFFFFCVGPLFRFLASGRPDASGRVDPHVGGICPVIRPPAAPFRLSVIAHRFSCKSCIHENGYSTCVLLRRGSPFARGSSHLCIHVLTAVSSPSDLRAFLRKTALPQRCRPRLTDSKGGAHRPRPSHAVLLASAAQRPLVGLPRRAAARCGRHCRPRPPLQRLAASPPPP